MFIARPSFLFKHIASARTAVVESGPLHTAGIIAALVAATTGAAAFIIVRKIAKIAHPTHSVAYLSYVSTICSIIFYPLIVKAGKWVWPSDPGVYFWYFILGSTGYVGQVLFSASLRLETAAKASTYNYTQVFFSFAFEALVFGKPPNPWSIIGACIIGISIIGIFFAKMHKERKMHEMQLLKNVESKPEKT